MKDINIIPIFNQAAPDIWDSFINIRACAMREVYNYKFTADDYVVAMDDFWDVWHKQCPHFAFGAYDGTEMVGFVQGYCIDKTAKLDNLYVMPKYMRHGIGGKLLLNAERSIAPYADYIELVSLLHAQKFYRQNQYLPVFSNGYYKNITADAMRTAVVPVFHPNAKIIRECKRIAKMNCSDFVFERSTKNAHMPMFVYVDTDAVIRGFVVGDDNNNKINITRQFITPHFMTQCISSRFASAIQAINMTRSGR